MKVSAERYVQAARNLLDHAQLMPIPYVNNGHTLAGMDCQGLAEYLLTQCGISYTDCNLPGSNSHLRECVWRGTPEECVKEFGSVPDGSWLFIVKHNNGEPEKYRGDGIGNAEHMGVYMSGTSVIHSSSSQKGVAKSYFDGKSIPNGGWNMVGLCKWVDYCAGTAQEQEPFAGEGTAYVVSDNGNAVHLRRDPSTNKPYLAKLSVGMPVEVISTNVIDGVEWTRVRASGKLGYMQSQFLRRALQERPPTTTPPSGLVTVTLERELAGKLLSALQTGMARE